MPKTNKKQELLDCIDEMAINDLLMLEVSRSSDGTIQQQKQDEILEEWIVNSLVVNSCRYSVPIYSVPKSNHLLTDVLPNLDENRFKQIVRVSRTNFEVITNLIRGNKNFEGPRSCLQFSVEMQLAIVLYRLGSSGEGASVSKVARLFGVGDGGTQRRIIERVFDAILAIKDKFLYWPGIEERQNIVSKTYHELPHCIGYVDGSEIKLAEKPSQDPESYFSRKHMYSMKVQAVCDYQFRIRHMVLGYPGSVHDSRIYNNCGLALKSSEFLSGAEWLAADSAYKLTTTVLTPFRANSKEGTLQERNDFNKSFCRYRVRIEQCFGILKERFNSLKELKIQIKDDSCVKFACRWVLVCAILHNIIIDQKNDDVVELQEQVDDDVGQENFEIENDNALSTPGQLKRRALLEFIKGMNT